MCLLELNLMAARYPSNNISEIEPTISRNWDLNDANRLAQLYTWRLLWCRRFCVRYTHVLCNRVLKLCYLSEITYFYGCSGRSVNKLFYQHVVIILYLDSLKKRFINKFTSCLIFSRSSVLFLDLVYVVFISTIWSQPLHIGHVPSILSIPRLTITITAKCSENM